MQKTTGQSNVVTDKEFDRNGLKETYCRQPGSAGCGDEMDAPEVMVVTVK